VAGRDPSGELVTGSTGYGNIQKNWDGAASRPKKEDLFFNEPLVVGVLLSRRDQLRPAACLRRSRCGRKLIRREFPVSRDMNIREQVAYKRHEMKNALIDFIDHCIAWSFVVGGCKERELCWATREESHLYGTLLLMRSHSLNRPAKTYEPHIHTLLRSHACADI